MQGAQKPYHPENIAPVSPFNQGQNKSYSQVSEDNIENDVNAICRNINKIIQKPEQMSEKVFSLNVNANAQQQAAPRQYVQPQAAKPADYSAVIINQFQKYFAERRKQNPQLDSSIRGLAETAVINEIVPVLQQWLNETLPLIVREEIKRVMAKASKPVNRKLMLSFQIFLNTALSKNKRICSNFMINRKIY